MFTNSTLAGSGSRASNHNGPTAKTAQQSSPSAPGLTPSVTSGSSVITRSGRTSNPVKRFGYNREFGML